MTSTRIEHEPTVETSRNGHDVAGGRVVRRERRPRGVAIVAVALVLASGGWAYWSHKTTRAAMDMNVRASSGANSFPVTVARVESGAIQGTVSYTGSVA